MLQGRASFQKFRTRLAVVVITCLPGLAIAATHCPYYEEGRKQIYWGDLHAHSGYSLDAWGYGTTATPADAYRFGQGEALRMYDGVEVQLARPLDFMAVTDHAEWFNLLHICTDPVWSEAPYCKTMTEKNSPATGTEVFGEYVIPTITKANPVQPALCEQDPAYCADMQAQQWRRIQVQGNAANDPCHFTAFLGFEWSATPGFSHNHRNVIFANDQVTAEAIDYLRFPSPEKLWSALDRQCREEEGCKAIAIPHNTNMGDGKSFDVETESADILAMRARYETLVEVHQQKGNSECLPAFASNDEECNFELYLTKNSVPTGRDGYDEGEWERMRSGYVRGLLLRGIQVYEQSGRQSNPLLLGMIGSTDNHAGTGGFVDEAQWRGSVFGIGDLDRTLSRLTFNPGGLVAVWAEENTRASIFSALQRREVFATSGPRMRLRVLMSERPLTCTEAVADPSERESHAMGAQVKALGGGPYFRVQAQFDRTPLQAIEMVKGALVEGAARERVERIWHQDSGGLDVCVTWRDAEFDHENPAFWYVRVLEAPSPRWSAYRCRAADRCDEFPDAYVTIQERAWSSPIWYLPD